MRLAIELASTMAQPLPMRRVYAVIELHEFSTFDPSSDDHLDELAEDLLHVTHAVASVAVFPTLADLSEDEKASAPT